MLPMKNEFFKKFTALLLAVLMLASLSPVSFADNGEEQTEPTAVEETQSSADSGEGTEAGDVTPADETGSGDSAEDCSEPEEAPSGDEPGDADPADEGEDPEEGEEGETGEDGEDEENALPYGLNGMPEGWELSDSERRAKERVIASGMPGAMAGLEEGTDYVSGRLIFSCSNHEYALTVAEAYSAELISCAYGIAVIAPQTAGVRECFECALDETYNLPLVEPDYTVALNPADGEMLFAAAPGVSAASTGVPVSRSWRSTIAALGSPDPLLSNPEAANYQWFHDAVNSYEAWGVTTGSGSVTVAVLDSGINTSHLDLQSAGGRTVTADYIEDTANSITSAEDSYGHGTHVAALIAGELGNGIAGAGIAPGVSIVSIRVLNSAGRGSESTIIAGINKAVQVYGADIINMSLGSNYYSETYYAAVSTAVNDYGATFVTAMGNNGANQRIYPAGYNIEGIIAVSSSNRAGEW